MLDYNQPIDRSGPQGPQQRSDASFNVLELVSLLWRRKIAIAAAALIGASLAVTIGKSLTPRYTATAQLYVDPRELQLVDRELTPRAQDVSGLATDVSRELDREAFGASEHDRFVVAGAGHDEATALEAVLKLREGAHVAAEFHHTEQLLHGHLAAVDPGVRCFVLEGAGRAAERAVDAMRALGELGCEALLVPTTHPVVDIVRFQLLTCDLAESRGIDPDMIRWDEDPWDRARQAQEWTGPTDL